MAILRSNGIVLVKSLPTHTPVGNEATLARLDNTTTHYYYDGHNWLTVEFNNNKPLEYDTRALALLGLGAGKPFVWSDVNTDGQVGGTQGWT